MKRIFASYLEGARYKFNPGHVRIGLAVLSLMAMVLGGSASDKWA